MTGTRRLDFPAATVNFALDILDVVESGEITITKTADASIASTTATRH